jgi:hypothetical protein
VTRSRVVHSQLPRVSSWPLKHLTESLAAAIFDQGTAAVKAGRKDVAPWMQQSSST